MKSLGTGNPGKHTIVIEIVNVAIKWKHHVSDNFDELLKTAY